MALAEIGVCYYPEHWPRTRWPTQARLMAEAGITRVRIGEFAWSRVEPAPEQFDWQWLDEAVDVLADAGLGVIMCTPTACPPRWLVNAHPEILPTARDGSTRGFGSRRHYRFASRIYRREAERISRAYIDRYAAHPGVVGWQTDNEYGCHDTTCSYAEGDKKAFQRWLRERYSSIESVNACWGTTFWSQAYRDFDDIELPNLTVTEANPSHWLDFRRFSSDQVVEFNRLQVNLIRASKGADRWVTHNFMGNYTGFDHFDVGRDIDVATWDSYPLGFLDQGWASEADKLRYRQIGHPDWAGFHHDLYRATGRGRFGVMEQQPGPVNWAPHNAEPLGSAPAFWALEAIAHGAELVSYFRFQQLPQAQEQMHAALRLPDGSPAPAWEVVCELTRLLASLENAIRAPSAVALLFDYAAAWSTSIQPHASQMSALEHALDTYIAARGLGLNIDIVGPESSLEQVKILIIPGAVFVSEALVDRIESRQIRVLVCARSGSRDSCGALPAKLAPGALQALIPLRVVSVDSMRPGSHHHFQYNQQTWSIEHWRERVETRLAPRVTCADGVGFWYEHHGTHYLNGRVGPAFLQRVLLEICAAAGIETYLMPEGLRRQQRGHYTFLFNFSPDAQSWDEPGSQLIAGDQMLGQGAWSIWSSHE